MQNIVVNAVSTNIMLGSTAITRITLINTARKVEPKSLGLTGILIATLWLATSVTYGGNSTIE